MYVFERMRILSHKKNIILLLNIDVLLLFFAHFCTIRSVNLQDVNLQ